MISLLETIPVLLYFVQLVVLILGVANDDIYTKKQFLIYLVPFLPLILTFLELE